MPSKDKLFKELCSPHILRIGWHLAALDARDDFVADSLRYADYALSLENQIDYLIQEIRSDRYRPRSITNIDVPKTSLSVRPGCILPIEESTILHAMVYLLAPKIDRYLNKQVFSYRLHKDWERRVRKGRSLFQDDDRHLPFLKRKTIKKFDPIDSWYVAWPEFDKLRKQALAQDGYTFAAKTDISAYFENIDLRLLEQQLTELVPDEPRLVGLMFRMLAAWTRTTAHGIPINRGLPQGNDVSSFLGNVYLIPLDRVLINFALRRKSVWFRYVDDVDVFTPSEEAAREAVFKINDALRALHLNLQGSKTAIFRGPELREQYESSSSDLIDKTWDVVRKMPGNSLADMRCRRQSITELRKIAAPFRRKSTPTELKGTASRVFRRLLTVYGFCESSWLKNAALLALRQGPELRTLQKTLRYLTQQPIGSHDKIAASLVALVREQKYLLPFQVAAIFEALSRLHPQEYQAIGSCIRQIAQRKRTEWVVRQKAGEALFVLPYKSRNIEIMSKFLLEDSHPWVRRAGALLLLRGSRQFAEQQTTALLYHPDVLVHRMALLWRRYWADRDFAEKEINRVSQSIESHVDFSRNLYRLWALRLSDVSSIRTRLETMLTSGLGSKSPIVRWHSSAILREIAGI